MKRLWIPISLLVVVPVIALAAIGWRIAHNERALLYLEYQDSQRVRLEGIQSQIASYMTSYSNMLARRLRTVATKDPSELRSLRRSSPEADMFFMLDKNGSLYYPNPFVMQTTKKEELFYNQTKNIWDSRALLSQRPKAENAVSYQKSFQLLSKSSAITPKWHSYYWSNGLHLMLYLRTSTGDISGFALNRSRFIADLIGALPDDSAGLSNVRIAVANAGKSELYGWGLPGEGQEMFEVVSIPLLPPLDSWKLSLSAQRITPFEGIGSSVFLNFLAALASIAIILITLGIYLHWAYTRQMREAASRVSFVNQVSHELKTPLTNIRMYSELLEDRIDEKDEKTSKYLSIVLSESARLSRLISNVLSFAKHERNKLALTYTVGDLAETINDVIEQFRPSLTEHNITLELDTKSSGLVTHDRDALQQILGNLISNVEKYAPSGSKLKLSLRQTMQTSTITIADNGPGIPKAKRKEIFKPFTRLSNSVSEGVSGTGIGLSIARELAIKHGGSLEIANTKKGTTMILTLHTPRGGK